METSISKRQKGAEAQKRYYQRHRDKLLSKFTCPCGGSFDLFHFNQHVNTNKHQKYMGLEKPNDSLVNQNVPQLYQSPPMQCT